MTSVRLNIDPEVKLLDHMIILFLILGNCCSGYIILHLYKYCPSVCFSTSSTLVISVNLFLINNHPDECKGLSHCGFDLHFPSD